MTLFVGGPLHGLDIDVPPITDATGEQHRNPIHSAILPNPNQPGPATQHQWGMFDFTRVLPATTQHPEATWTFRVYLHASMGALTIDQAFTYFVDAAAGWWMRTNGHVTQPAALQVVGPHAPSGNGTPPEQTAWAMCTGCTGEEGQPIPFTSLKNRATWIQAHINNTGHRILAPLDGTKPEPTPQPEGDTEQ